MNQNQSIVSRIAPTPSGYLHIGNAANFLLTWWITRYQNGKLILRIDDADTTRRRMEFLDDIFESLRWLGIDWDAGPVDTADFLKGHSQSLRTEEYFSALSSSHSIFACDCTRKKIKDSSLTGIYPGLCRKKGLVFERGACALRIEVSSKAIYQFGSSRVELSKAMGDFVVWRKDDIPAYQLTSVLDDESMGVNLIIRGEDLLESSAAQLYLAEDLGLKEFAKAKIIHHPLILDNHGNKLSKSQSEKLSDIHLKTLREKSLNPVELARRLAESHGISPSKIGATADLLKFQPPYLK